MALNIQALIQNVTPEQVGMAHKIISSTGNFYLVENSKGELDDDGNLIEYKVTYTKEFGFQCTCKAGQFGFAHCRNLCWHCRAAVACDEEIKQAMHEQVCLNVQAVEKPATPAIVTDVDAVTLARVMRRSEEQASKPTRKYAPLNNRAFSILK